MEEKYAKLAYLLTLWRSQCCAQSAHRRRRPRRIRCCPSGTSGYSLAKAALESWGNDENGTRVVWSPLPGAQVVTEHCFVTMRGHPPPPYGYMSEITCEAPMRALLSPTIARCSSQLYRHRRPRGTPRRLLCGRGPDRSGTPLVLDPAPNTSPQYPRTVILMVQYDPSRHNGAGNRSNICLRKAR